MGSRGSPHETLPPFAPGSQRRPRICCWRHRRPCAAPPLLDVKLISLPADSAASMAQSAKFACVGRTRGCTESDFIRPLDDTCGDVSRQRVTSCTRLVAGCYQRICVCDGRGWWHHKADSLRSVDDGLAATGEALAPRRYGVGGRVLAVQAIPRISATVSRHRFRPRRFQEHLLLGVGTPHVWALHWAHLWGSAGILCSARPYPARSCTDPSRTTFARRLARPRRLVDGQVGPRGKACR